jgi:2-polyprenyl-6-hydroxyphenyl methylase/3-demethylubiquinone-9 3-methyltransferase
MTPESASADPRFVAYFERDGRSSATHRRFERIRARALRLLQDGGRTGPFDVVDVGCATGAQALLWAELGHRVLAIDLCPELVTLARREAAARGLGVTFEVASATALPCADASADAVLLPELIEHVPDWEACLAEAVRVLRPGGLLYLSTTNRLCPRQREFSLPLYAWWPSPVKRWCERRATTTHRHWVNFATHPAVNWFSWYQLAAWLRARGFDPIDRFDMLAREPAGGLRGALLAAMRRVPALRALGHVAVEGTTVWAIRRRPAGAALPEPARAPRRRSPAAG